MQAETITASWRPIFSRTCCCQASERPWRLPGMVVLRRQAWPAIAELRCEDGEGPVKGAVEKMGKVQEESLHLVRRFQGPNWMDGGLQDRQGQELSHAIAILLALLLSEVGHYSFWMSSGGLKIDSDRPFYCRELTTRDESPPSSPSSGFCCCCSCCCCFCFCWWWCSAHSEKPDKGCRRLHCRWVGSRCVVLLSVGAPRGRSSLSLAFSLCPRAVAVVYFPCSLLTRTCNCPAFQARPTEERRRSPPCPHPLPPSPSHTGGWKPNGRKEIPCLALPSLLVPGLRWR